MEYCILKIYEKQKCSELEQGFDRYEPSVKKKIIVCLATMFVAYAEMILMLLLYPRRLWYLIGGIWIYSYKFFDPLKKNYEMLVKDLKDLLLMKF